MMVRTENASISRRGFLGAGIAGAALVGLAGCSSEKSVLGASVSGEGGGEPRAEAEEIVYRLDPELDPSVEGRWVPAPCWHNCGGRCANYAFVSDGVVLRQKTDDYHEDSWEHPQQRSCLRGRSQQWQTFGSERLKYPMKRKGWSPDAPNGELRGKDEWERISWDEALDYIADQIKRSVDEYGPSSVFCASGNSPTIKSALSAIGGYTEWTDSASFGSFNENVMLIGLPLMGLNGSCDRLSLMKSDTIVLYGCNPAWASGGIVPWILNHAKENGAEFVFVGPEYNVTASLLEARWIRVRPGTDTAFLLAVAYEMIVADEQSGGSLIDQEFLDTHCVGYDGDHMPADAQIDENFKDYVLGAYDDQPKTAEWASEITGTPVEDIRWYAELMGKQNKVALLHSFAAARCNNAESLPQLFYAVGAMGAHLAGEGNTVGAVYHTQGANHGASLVSVGYNGNRTLPNTEGADCLRAPEAWDAILNGTYNYTGNFSMYAGAYAPSEQRSIDIHVIYIEGVNPLQTWPGIAKGMEAFRKVDFVVTQGHFLNLSASFSDIVLPITTLWEREDTSPMLSMTNRELAWFPQKIIEPLYEAKDDIWVSSQIADRLGLNGSELYPFVGGQARYNMLASSTLLTDPAAPQPLFEISQEDIDAMGAQGQPQEGAYPLSDIADKGYVTIPRAEGDGFDSNYWAAFVADPAAAPLPSASGKLEIYCQAWADMVNGQGRSTIKPYPTYVKPLNGYEESFADWDGKMKGEYPYQLFTPHYLRRSHTVFDNVEWVREAMENPVFINASDAAEKGISEGDTVLVFNQYGKVLRKASVSERIMPGVVSLPHGSWVDFDEETGIDHGGSDNMLCAPQASGAGTSGYNTNLVNYEKYNGEALEDDYLRPVPTALV